MAIRGCNCSANDKPRVIPTERSEWSVSQNGGKRRALLPSAHRHGGDREIKISRTHGVFGSVKAGYNPPRGAGLDYIAQV